MHVIDDLFFLLFCYILDFAAFDIFAMCRMLLALITETPVDIILCPPFPLPRFFLSVSNPAIVGVPQCCNSIGRRAAIRR